MLQGHFLLHRPKRWLFSYFGLITAIDFNVAVAAVVVEVAGAVAVISGRNYSIVSLLKVPYISIGATQGCSQVCVREKLLIA